MGIIRKWLEKGIVAKRVKEIALKELVDICSPAAWSEVLKTEVFEAKFLEDLKNMREDALIFSPYLNEEAVNNFIIDIKTHKIDPKKISIVTRPLEESDEKAVRAIKALVKENFNVYSRPKMHYKLAIIDDIIYIGSLNILQCYKRYLTKPEEEKWCLDYMIRLRSSGLVQEILGRIAPPSPNEKIELQHED